MQAAKTYLERKFEVFGSCSVDELIGHGLRALSASVSDGELTPENCTVAVVGKGLSLVLLEGDALKPHIDSLKVGTASHSQLHSGMTKNDEHVYDGMYKPAERSFCLSLRKGARPRDFAPTARPQAEEAGDDGAPPAADEQPAAAETAEPATVGDGGTNGDGAAPMES